MKKLLIFISFILISLTIKTVKAENVNDDNKIEVVDDIEFDLQSPSAILIEANSGKVIYKKECLNKMAPASMTKIMTMILIMEAIDEGKLKYEDKLIASEYAASMGGTTIYLDKNEEMSVEDLLKGLVIASANDAAIVFSESIGGTTKQFVQTMNDKAKEIGCLNTNFENPNGLPQENHYSCSYDMALMGRYLINNYPQILKYSNTYEDYLRKGTDKEFWLVNTNKLIKFYNEVDGLKTGWTSESGYCLTATMKKNNIRFISVVMGADSIASKNKDTMMMLSYGVNNYELVDIVKEGDIYKTITNIMYYPKEFDVLYGKDVKYLTKKGIRIDDIKTEVFENNDYKNNIYGKVKIIVNNKEYDEIDLILDANVSRANFFQIYKSIFEKVFL